MSINREKCLFVPFENGKEKMHQHFKELGGYRDELGWYIKPEKKKDVSELCTKSEMIFLEVEIEGDFERNKIKNNKKYLTQKFNELKDKIDQKNNPMISEIDLLEPLNREIRSFICETDDGKKLLEKIDEYQKIHTSLKRLNNEELVSNVKPATKTIINTESKPQKISDVLIGTQFFEKIKFQTQFYQATKKTPLSGISTGYQKLDGILDGFQKEQLITLAARTGMGKTWVTLNLIKNIAIEQKIPTALFSLEMSNSQIIYRLLSLCTNIETVKIKKGMLNEQELNEVEMAIKKICDSPLYIIDCPSNSYLIDLKKNFEAVKDEIKIAIIDHIGLIKAEHATSNNRAVEVGAITRTLKIMAKENKIPILCVAQLNRNADKDERPKLSDLRESGCIEQDSDVVIFVHRKDYYAEENDPEKMEIIIEKNREGEQGKVIPFKYNKKNWQLAEVFTSESNLISKTIQTEFPGITKRHQSKFRDKRNNNNAQ